MARKIIDIGTVGNDGTGDSIRDSFRKVNDNFRELYSSLGLGEKLKFIGLDDTPEAYLGQENAVLSVNNTETGLIFKQIIPGSGIQLDVTTSENEIRISSEFSEVVGDTSPQLGGPLSAFSGGDRFAIGGLIDLNNTSEFQSSLSALSSTFSGVGDSNNADRVAVNKAYADRKIDRAGVLAIDPATGEANSAFGTMTGPLILARNPIPDDDETYDGLIAATKRYVDNSAFGSAVNLYVATSGADERVGVSPELQGRALAYAYRTLEAALKRAEEIVLESRKEIGPYKKTLTYNDGASECTLSDIIEAPGDGAGFSGSVLMSVDSISINSVGVNYNVGDIITIEGGTYAEPARYEVLSTATTPGAIVTFRQLSSGVYTTLPGNTNVATTTNSAFGDGATFDLTYKVNNVQLISGGSGYGLVSVRIVGGGGAGAFGTADVVGGVVQSITITDQGSGFTSLPSVVVNLPRFLIETGGQRTDFTGDVTTDTPTAIRGRDIREGLFLRGEDSGALAQILAHQGDLDSEGNEIFDVDIKFGSFQIGEVISYGDVTITTQITILVETGIYEENLPLRVPQNVSIVGDEFRRCIVRPRPGVSSSPWAFIYFRRDLTIGVEGRDLLNIANRQFGYHYLSDSSQPVYPLVNNKGYYRSAAELIRLNRAFIQKEVIRWIADQSANEISPFFAAFSYDEDLYERDIGLILDAMIFDLKWGGSDRTVSSALKYYTTTSGRLAITTQLAQTVAAIRRVGTLAQLVIRNVPITETYQIAFPQIVDGAFIAEVGVGGTSFNINGVTSADPVVVTTSTAHGLITGDQVFISDVGGTVEINGNDYYVDVIDEFSFYLYSDAGLTLPIDGSDFGEYTSGGSAFNNGGVINAFIETIIDVIDGSGSVNYPLDNDRMDVFLCNDAVRLQAITCQGQGGFMMVLDPYGQILAKSPYAQECASFSKSTGRQTFAGGMYIDGFAGNIKFKIISKDSNTYLRVGNLNRMPQLPASFIVADNVYRINYVRDFTFNIAGSTASFILDETTPWPFDIFDYDEDICRRDAGLILDGLGYDIVLGTNFNQRKAGLTYRQANAAVVINDQLDLTVRAIDYTHDTTYNLLTGYNNAREITLQSKTTLSTIIRNGTTFAPSLLFTDPPGLAANKVAAKTLLISNIEFIKDETIGYLTTTYPSLTFNSAKCARDVQYIIEAVIYDILYGGNSATRDAGLKYYDGVGDLIESQLPGAQTAPTSDGILYASYLAQQVIVNATPAVIYSSTPQVTGVASDASVQAEINSLVANIESIITSGVGAADSLVLPDLDAYAYSAGDKAARNIIVANKTDLQQATITFVDDNANVYEVLMPGNRSMLSNDFTQINDLGYGVVVNNGGLAEAVSMFTYYCHISYYSVNGGQIRSVGGSSAHGNYALVAEGADPLEVPTPVTLYYDLAQGADVYFPSPAYANTSGGLVLYVTNFNYVPLDNSEIEVDHGLGSIYRYPVTSVSQDESLPAGVARLSLASSEGAGVDGLAAVIPDGQRITIRSNAQVILTGDVVEVAVRPSTGLVLRESPEVYRILQFEDYVDPVGGRSCTITTGDPTVINKVGHGLQPGYQIELQSTGTLPDGLSSLSNYYVLADGWTENSFAISLTKAGFPVVTTSAGSGSFTYTVFGLARTSLRENYNYVDMTVWPTQPYASGPDICTISIASPAVVTLTGHSFNAGDVIRFETTGSLPSGLSVTRQYFVHTVLDPDTFTVTVEAITTAVEIDTSGSQSGTHYVGPVIGNVGDSSFAIVPLGAGDIERIIGTKMVWFGEEYTVVGYSGESVTLEPYALLTISPALNDSVIYFTSLPTLKSAVPRDEPGTLTIRIALTRVTSHDLLEIGTGSYADTNYPNEIYGPALNPLNPAAEVEERGVGRCFYVTTDQFGNFSVGPYFRVDQGTGTVTFAAAIALSNLDGIGFKRGVPVAEFSTDSSFSDNATDTVPTENAARGYIERRLGLSHTGAIIPDASLIPSVSGGFMALDGQLAMKNDMDLGDHRITNVASPVNPTDAVNLESLVFTNLADFNVIEPRASDLLIFTGNLKEAQNATVVGDLSFDIDSTAFTIDAQINPEVILDADINPAAGIQQSKLLMNAATTRADATGITQADKGVASFDSAQFTATDGWITVKNNGLAVTKIAQITTKTVLGNSSLVTGNVSAVPFSTVVNDGLAIKKSQYNTGTGYLRRIGFTATQDTDYTIVDEASTNTPSTLVKRDSNGDFSARNISVEQLKVDGVTTLDTTTSATGGYLQIYGFSGQVGILIGDGSVATDKRTFYDNDAHIFRTQNGLSNGSVTVGTLTATSITTGGTSTAGTITGTWSLASGSRLQATYADLAEYYEADKEYPVGTVLVFDGDKEVTISNSLADHRIAGVVSDNAAYTMNQDCPGTKVLIALQGRVPCRVVGKIKKGDLMVTSKIQGVAVSVGGDAKAGTIIGKALENYDSDHIGTIEVAVGRA
jgi:hypothetical protein